MLLLRVCISESSVLSSLVNRKCQCVKMPFMVVVRQMAYDKYVNSVFTHFLTKSVLVHPTGKRSHAENMQDVSEDIEVGCGEEPDK